MDTYKSREIGVLFCQDNQKRGFLTYRPGRMPWQEFPPEEVKIQIIEEKLKQDLDNFSNVLNELIMLGRLNRNRQDIGVESAVFQLSKSILPPSGLAGLLEMDIHPQFDLVQNVITSKIPWESLEERIIECQDPDCKQKICSFKAESEGRCRSCGKEVAVTMRKLVESYHICHLPRGRERKKTAGSKFVLIIDPVDNICTKGPDICQTHIDEIYQLLEKRGFETAIYPGCSATIQKVKEVLSDNALAGVYYYGHGAFTADGAASYLELSDGKLFASEIEEIAPTASCIFANACWGAADPPNPTLKVEDNSYSIAHSFICGVGRGIAIAPLWPIVADQAAEFALEFFKSASEKTIAADAMKDARALSLDKYKSGKPHIGWLSYRYFGNPNTPFPIPKREMIVINGKESRPLADRVFGKEGFFDTDVFAPDMESIFLRAAKRRNFQQRDRVTTVDFIMGIIRSGSLTRWVLKRNDIDPDSLYEKISLKTDHDLDLTTSEGDTQVKQEQESDWVSLSRMTPESMDEQQINEMLSRWTIREKAQLSDELINVLRAADKTCQKREGWESRISEQDILEEMLQHPVWDGLSRVYLPPRQTILDLLEVREKEQVVDRNGALILSFLDAAAFKIVSKASVLSQQTGCFPISNRMMMAALVAEENSFGSKICKKNSLDPTLLFALMMLATPGDKSAGFTNSAAGLSYEAAERIVMKALNKAKQIASDKNSVSEEDLFRAFCETADSGFKEMLKNIFGLDLDRDPNHGDDLNGPFVTELLNRIEPAARRIVEASHSFSQCLGASQITSRVLLAAFLREPESYANALFEEKGLTANLLFTKLLEASRSGPPQAKAFSPSSCERIVTPMIEEARKRIPDPLRIDERTLFSAFCEVAPQNFKDALIRAFNTDLDAIAKGECAQSAAETTEAVISETGEENRGPGSLQETGSSDDPPNQEARVQSLDLKQFEASIREAIHNAAGLAMIQGWSEIKSPHLFAALIGNGKTLVAVTLLERSIDPIRVKEAVLSLVPPLANVLDATTVPSISRHVFDILTRSMEIASSSGNIKVGLDDLMTAFFEDGGGVVGDWLHQMRILLPFMNGGWNGSKTDKSGPTIH